ncbi:MAG: MFS transporter [Alphaproteobacteria bacterium]|nr:MFS transporter [Alphaproteobacteria bacterium]
MLQKRLTTAYTIWFCAVLFYLYQYIIRVSPSVMKDDLMVAFNVSASGFSSLSSFALYCYALMQIPVGMLVDHYGTRRMVLSSIFLCATGVVLFASCEQLALGYLARMMMGTGSACAFLSVSKIVNEWFPDTHKGIMMGFVPTFGTLGAYLGGPPLVMLIENQGWRTSLLILATIGFVVLVLNFLSLPTARKGSKEIIPGEETVSFQALMAVFKNGQAWLFGFVAIGIYLSISVVADLWGVSFVQEKFMVSKQDAAQMISYMYFGTACGCPIFGWISRVIGSVKYTLLIGATGTVAFLGYLVFASHIPLWLGNATCFSIGICTGAEILCFIAACEMMGPEVSGTMTGFLNCIVSLAGAMIQQHVGMVLDYFWDGALLESGVRAYSIHTYKVAFGVILFFSFTSCLFALFIKSQRKSPSKTYSP